MDSLYFSGIEARAILWRKNSDRPNTNKFWLQSKEKVFERGRKNIVGMQCNVEIHCRLSAPKFFGFGREGLFSTLNCKMRSR